MNLGSPYRTIRQPDVRSALSLAPMPVSVKLAEAGQIAYG
jgi:hypothetical protein